MPACPVGRVQTIYDIIEAHGGEIRVESK